MEYLKSLGAVRETTTKLLLNYNHLTAFDLDLTKVETVVQAVLSLIERDYSSLQEIPMHSRYRHFNAKPINNYPTIDHISMLLKCWSDNVPKIEIVKRLLDLIVVSVLLDAGAGDAWKYTLPTGPVYTRSEGLAIASLDWFKNGGFSSDSSRPYQCDATGLLNIKQEHLDAALQVSDHNPLIGAQGRCMLLQRLGSVCIQYPQFFGSENPRPGNLIDYILTHPSTVTITKDIKYSTPIDILWQIVIQGFAGVWPESRTKLNGKSLGDVWPSKALAHIHAAANPDAAVLVQDSLVAFHKLSQWLTYSLLEPLAMAGIEFTGIEVMTGLAEYRNGGLFVDYGILSLKPEIKSRFLDDGVVPRFEVSDDVVVEWRALTVALLDIVSERVRTRLGMCEQELPLVKILEAGTWKAGREIAAKLRPLTRGPPIEIISDGTVF